METLKQMGNLIHMQIQEVLPFQDLTKDHSLCPQIHPPAALAAKLAPLPALL